MEDKTTIIGNTISVSVGEDNEEGKILISSEGVKSKIIHQNEDFVLIEATMVIPKKILKKSLKKDAKDMELEAYVVVEANRSDMPDYILTAVDEKTNGLIVRIDPQASNENLIPIVREINGKD